MQTRFGSQHQRRRASAAHPRQFTQALRAVGYNGKEPTEQPPLRALRQIADQVSQKR